MICVDVDMCTWIQMSTEARRGHCIPWSYSYESRAVQHRCWELNWGSRCSATSQPLSHLSSAVNQIELGPCCHLPKLISLCSPTECCGGEVMEARKVEKQFANANGFIKLCSKIRVLHNTNIYLPVRNASYKISETELRSYTLGRNSNRNGVPWKWHQGTGFGSCSVNQFDWVKTGDSFQTCKWHSW